jgi:3-hydroxyacyl-CoA dehydrogenase/enoyl-CoA hydratase/3-hydroxybutyryl-CoA epimerase
VSKKEKIRVTKLPDLREFRLELAKNGVAHLVFDCPGRSMNVFSNAAILELGVFAAWLKTADIAGVVVRSAKPAFCAGADLAELGAAYDMIMAAPQADRFQLAFDHFFALSRGLRALETSGKPVAAAITGLALGGGCELALGCHYRVMADSPRAALGLPEALVGLLPGAGGTQRLPRLIGVEAALPVLLDGKRLTPVEALACGAVHAVVAVGDEVAAAERWVLAAPDHRQPWDRAGWRDETPQQVGPTLAPARKRVLAETHGHYPAPLAILDCIERGLVQPIDQAIETEMTIFAGLIQRPEPRNMIQTLFLGKLDHDRRAAKAELPPALPEIEASVRAALVKVSQRARADGHSDVEIARAYRAAGFTVPLDGSEGETPSAPPGKGGAGSDRRSAEFWFESPLATPLERWGAAFVIAGAEAVGPQLATTDATERRLMDYALVSRLGFPSYLGGPFALLDYLGGRSSLAFGG